MREPKLLLVWGFFKYEELMEGKEGGNKIGVCNEKL